MVFVLARKDIKTERVQASKPGSSNTFFLQPDNVKQSGPTAFINKYAPSRISSSHYHIVDQFQVTVAGKGKFSRHDVSPFNVHFSRAYTPYGPLVADQDTGMSFLTLRTRFDPGAIRFPEAKEELRKIPNRKPWQVTKQFTFPSAIAGVNLELDPAIQDDKGLFAGALTMSPHTKTVSPDLLGGDGQYIVITNGSMIYDGRELEPITLAFLQGTETLEIEAGPQGLEALILNFPQVEALALQTPPRAAETEKAWHCQLCAYAYDERLGAPDDGIAPGTRWEDVPEDWTCPDCSASKEDFVLMEIQSA